LRHYAHALRMPEREIPVAEGAGSLFLARSGETISVSRRRGKETRIQSILSGMEWGPKRAFADPETTSMVAVAVVVLVATYGAEG
jgi:hypothetical protein